MAKPGPKNLITDVDGILLGNAHDENVRSGVTVILPETRAIAAVDVRGGGPGTRETDALDAENLVEAVDAICLTGGSVYGLEAPSGVAAWLGAQGKGFSMAGELVSPIVPSAVLFDLTNGGTKIWGEMPPYRKLGRTAAFTAAQDFDLGNQGAGYGAQAGAYKGGLGSASAVTEDGLQVGAVIAVNPFGSPLIPGTDVFWAWPFEQNGEFGGRRPPSDFGQIDMGFPSDTKAGALPGTNTTIGCVATNAKLTPAEAKRVAMMAQDGYARALRPIHTSFDGDTVFALATGTWPNTENGAREIAAPRAFMVSRIGQLAADCVARAIARGVYEAATLGEMRSYRDHFGAQKP